MTDRESCMFPDNKDRITCHDLTRDFLIYATDVRLKLVTGTTTAAVLLLQQLLLCYYYLSIYLSI